MQICDLCILALLRVYLPDCVFVYLCVCVCVYCVCLCSCVQASVIVCGQCVGTWRLLAARCRLPAWDLWNSVEHVLWRVWCCARCRRECAWSERHVIQYSWCGRTCLKCAQLNMLYWEDLARVSRLLEVRAIHCLRCGRRRTRVSRVCFKRREASQALLPSSCHSFKDPISFFSLCQVSQWWKSSSKSQNSLLKVYGLT